MSKFTYINDLNTCYTYGTYKYTSATKNLPYPAETNNFSGHGNILVLSSEYQETSTQNMWAVQLLYDNWGHIYKRIFNWHSWTNFIKIYPDYSSISLRINGYVIFTNGLIIQYGDKTTTFHDGFQDIHLSISFLNSFIYTVNFKNDAYIPIRLTQNLSTLEFIPSKISDGTGIYTGTYQVFYIAIGS